MLILSKKYKFKTSSISISSSRWSSKITPKETKTILKYFNSKKAPEIDKITIKLVKLSSDVLAEPIAINNSISASVFPNNTKITSVVPIDKKSNVYIKLFIKSL